MADRPGNSPYESTEGNPAPQPGSGSEAIAPGGHWLCSELVTVHWRDTSGAERNAVVNLEEIWPQGAILDAEEFVSDGMDVRLSSECFEDELHATVLECRESATGFALSVEFQTGSEWNPVRFPLSHAVNSSEIQQKAAEAAAGNQSPHPGNEAETARITPADRATDQALEQGSLYCLALHATRR